MNVRDSDMTPEQIRIRTERQNAARERIRLIQSKGLADNRYTASDQPDTSIEVLILDHRFNEVIHVEYRKTQRINSYRLFDMIKDEFIGKFGGSRGLTEIGRRLLNNINIVE